MAVGEDHMWPGFCQAGGRMPVISQTCCLGGLSPCHFFYLCSPKHALETSSSLPWLVPTERLAKAHHKQAHLEPRQLARWDWRPVMWARVLFRTHPLPPSPVFGLTLLVSGFVF